MQMSGGFAVLASGVFLAIGAAQAVPQSPSPADASTDQCVAVATAKYQQWHQPRVLLQRTKTFAKGSVATDEIIVTPNTGYKLYEGSWSTANITIPERGAASPEVMLATMRLAECSEDGTEEMSGQPVTHYVYSYKPDDNGFVSHGEMWISNATGLPLKQNLRESEPPANRLVATSISTTYAYNDAVEVPKGAVNAEATRLFTNAMSIEHYQTAGIGKQR